MRDNPIREISWSAALDNGGVALTHEWLVTNGIGGFTSSTVAGAITRRYHGLLVTALPAPQGRTVMLNHLHERIHFPDGQVVNLGRCGIGGSARVHCRFALSQAFSIRDGNASVAL